MKGLKGWMAVAVMISFASCAEKERIWTKKEIAAKVDSTVATKVDALNQEAMEDLDRRKSIEVKAKTDSIVEVFVRSQQPVADTNKRP